MEDNTNKECKCQIKTVDSLVCEKCVLKLYEKAQENMRNRCLEALPEKVNDENYLKIKTKYSVNLHPSNTSAWNEAIDTSQEAIKEVKSV